MIEYLRSKIDIFDVAWNIVVRGTCGNLARVMFPLILILGLGLTGLFGTLFSPRGYWWVGGIALPVIILASMEYFLYSAHHYPISRCSKCGRVY